jgi:UDP-N-acetylmuramoylalanine--D-glutamate ligase
MTSPFAKKRVVILGIGHFGGQIEAARFMCRAGARVLATDLKPAEKLTHALCELEGEPIEWRLGEHREEDLRAADLVVVSPAVPKTSPFLKLIEREKIPQTTEMNLTIERLRAPIYAVTGSNGKSTTTTLLARAVEAAGFRVFAGGNIGRPLLNEVDAIEPSDRVVLELSSFQLEDLRSLPRFEPALAIVTNLTPNHLDRHGTLEDYARAKRLLVERLGPQGVAVLNREDPRVLDFRNWTSARIATFGMAPPPCGSEGTFVAGGEIRSRDRAGCERAIVSLDEIEIPGRHNLMNVLAVAAATEALGLSPAALARALRGFRGIPDRLETVRLRRGVRYVNDSKATTPEAARAALEAFPPPVFAILGGQDKGMDLRPLVAAAVERARAVFLIGATRERLREAIERSSAERGAGPEEVRCCGSLEEALAAAERAAGPGATVVLTPGFASYDMFSSFEERGERFRALVRALPE